VYNQGANSTEPFFIAALIPRPTTTVGWFKGYPGFWDEGYVEVFKFDEDILYRAQGKFLTKAEALAIIEGLMAE